MTRRMPVILVVAAVLLTVLYWFVLYKPASDTQDRLTDETAQLETQRDDLRAQLASLEEVRDNEQDYRSQLIRLREFVPDDPAQPAALRELQAAADDAGVEITELTFADPEAMPAGGDTGDDTTTLARIPTQMTVEGGYFQVVDLFRRIEVDLARAVKVDTVEMAESEDLKFPDLAVTWSGSVFAVLPLDGLLGPDGEPAAPAETGSELASEGAAAPAESGTTAPAPADAAPAEGGTS